MPPAKENNRTDDKQTEFDEQPKFDRQVKFTDASALIAHFTDLLKNRQGDGNRCTVLAIDGRCAAGKTTLATYLARDTGSLLLHADDFFISSAQRGSFFLPHVNLDSERLLYEVLSPMHLGQSFFYRPFDCRTQQYKEARRIFPDRSVILEGSYLLHPAFRFAYTYTLFMDIDPSLQQERLRQRNPGKAEDFLKKWIPLEEEYIAFCALPQKEDFYFKNFTF